MQGKFDSNMMTWGRDDIRWQITWWGSYDTYHRLHEKWHEDFIKTNVWSWAEGNGLSIGAVRRAMKEAWKVAPYRRGIHGEQLYATEKKRYMAAYRKALKVALKEVA